MFNIWKTSFFLQKGKGELVFISDILNIFFNCIRKKLFPFKLKIT